MEAGLTGSVAGATSSRLCKDDVRWSVLRRVIRLDIASVYERFDVMLLSNALGISTDYNPLQYFAHHLDPNSEYLRVLTHPMRLLYFSANLRRLSANHSLFCDAEPSPRPLGSHRPRTHVDRPLSCSRHRVPARGVTARDP